MPKGYLRVLVFDRDSALVSQQTEQLQGTALNRYDSLRVRVLVPQDGYVSAYVGNESDVDVYFDDIRIVHGQGLQVQESEYDPTGLELAGMVGTTPGLKRLSQYKFNGKEFQPDLGLNWNHQDWRFFDPQLLRWHVVDPEVENGQESWTPYSFGFDNAVRFNDPDGRCPDGCPPNPMDGLKGSGNAASGPDLISAITTPFKNFVGDALTLTDVNDAAVLATTITRGVDNAINFDGNKAGGIGVGFAALGAVLPLVSGSAVKKVAGPALEYIGGKAYGAYKNLTKADRHHIIRDAAVRDIAGYGYKEAPNIHLQGPASARKTTEHGRATAVQVKRRAEGQVGTYKHERNTAYRALRAAGLNVGDAKTAVRKTDEYFSKLGVSLGTPTRQ